MVDGVKGEQNERCAVSCCEMIDSTSSSSHLIGEIVVNHKRKRVFLGLTDMEKNTYELQICEFRGPTYRLVNKIAYHLTQACLSIIYSCKHFISGFIIFYYPYEKCFSKSITEYNIQQCISVPFSPLWFPFNPSFDAITYHIHSEQQIRILCHEKLIHKLIFIIIVCRRA